jgi:serine/threonine protein kinase
MYAMLAGRPPFTAEEPLSIIHQVVNNVPVSLREMKEQCSREVVPIWLSDVVDRILARDPDDRPQSAVELRQCLVSKSITMLRHVDNSNDRTIQRLTARRSPRFGTARQLLSLATLGLLLVGAWFGTSWLLSNQSLPSPDALPTDASAAPEACTIAFADGKTADFASLRLLMQSMLPNRNLSYSSTHLGRFNLILRHWIFTLRFAAFQRATRTHLNSQQSP